MYRYNPDLREQGENPFTWDVPATEEVVTFNDYLEAEIRYKTLNLSHPEEAERLTELAKKDNAQRMHDIKHLEENVTS
jgi:pyruvate-ferredoxin/flavodoxin oxidoreductase